MNGCSLTLTNMGRIVFFSNSLSLSDRLQTVEVTFSKHDGRLDYLQTVNRLKERPKHVEVVKLDRDEQLLAYLKKKKQLR